MAAAIPPANASLALPAEMLLSVLRHVRHAEREEDQEQHISCLHVCKRWLQLGNGLFYQDIVVDDHNVDSFTAAVADWPDNFAVTRNLTVVLSLGWQES